MSEACWHKRVTVWLLGQYDPVVFDDAYTVDKGDGWLHVSGANGLGHIASFRWSDVRSLTAVPQPASSDVPRSE